MNLYKNINFFSYLIVGFFFLSGFLVVDAQQWSQPSSTPPDGNTQQPLHSGQEDQSKDGALGVQGSFTAGPLSASDCENGLICVTDSGGVGINENPSSSGSVTVGGDVQVADLSSDVAGSMAGGSSKYGHQIEKKRVCQGGDGAMERCGPFYFEHTFLPPDFPQGQGLHTSEDGHYTIDIPAEYDQVLIAAWGAGGAGGGHPVLHSGSEWTPDEFPTHGEDTIVEFNGYEMIAGGGKSNLMQYFDYGPHNNVAYPISQTGELTRYFDGKVDSFTSIQDRFGETMIWDQYDTSDAGGEDIGEIIIDPTKGGVAGEGGMVFDGGIGISGQDSQGRNGMLHNEDSINDSYSLPNMIDPAGFFEDDWYFTSRIFNQIDVETPSTVSAAIDSFHDGLVAEEDAGYCRFSGPLEEAGDGGRAGMLTNDGSNGVGGSGGVEESGLITYFDNNESYAQKENNLFSSIPSLKIAEAYYNLPAGDTPFAFAGQNGVLPGGGGGGAVIATGKLAENSPTNSYSYSMCGGLPGGGGGAFLERIIDLNHSDFGDYGNRTLKIDVGSGGESKHGGGDGADGAVKVIYPASDYLEYHEQFSENERYNFEGNYYFED